MTDLVTPVLTAIASFLGAGLAARLALRSFYAEKVWERKTIAYTAIFEALYDMHSWYDTHMNAEMIGKEIDEDEQLKLRTGYRAAKDALKRRLAAEVWLIPNDCRQRIENMFQELDKRGDDWIDMLEKNLAEIDLATKDLTRMIRIDLRLQPHPQRVWLLKLTGR